MSHRPDHPAGSPVLSVSDLLIRTRAGVPLVDGVSFDIAAGDCLALLGESGCGKSMTALGLMRLLPEGVTVGGGQVLYGGENLVALPEAAMRKRRGGGIGMIFQEPATSLNPVLTVGRQIGEALTLHTRLAGQAARRRTVELLDQVGIPDAHRRLDEYPFQLSGGLRQRVMIAMALAGNPRLLIADEPTTALDVTIQAQVLSVLDNLRREHGMALLLITHDLGVVARMASRVGVMYAGQLVEMASSEGFFAAAAHPYSQRLFAALPEAARGKRLETIPGSVPVPGKAPPGCRFADRCPQFNPACNLAPVGWRFASSGHAVRCVLYREEEGDVAGGGDVSAPAGPAAAGSVVPVISATPPAEVLQVSDLVVHFPIRQGVLQRTVGQVRAVDGISLSLRAGRTLALVGESGCGKTTAGKAILHLLQPTRGEVRLKGQALGRLTSGQLRPLRARMQMVFQDPFASLNPRMRVGELIAEGMLALGVALPPGGMGRRIGELLEQVGLRADMAQRYPHEFSGGQRQRIAIARALAVSPDLLICDEPTSALDVSVQAQIINLLADLQRDLNLAYLFITHNIAVVDYLADEVAVMYLGRIVEQGKTEEVLRAPRHPYTQALLSAVLPPRPGGGTGQPLSGEMPSPAAPPSGCHFHPRCPLAMEACRLAYPAQRAVSLDNPGHSVACFAIAAPG